MTWLTVAEYLCHRWPRKWSVSGSRNAVLLLSWIQDIPLVEQELPTIPEHMSSIQCLVECMLL